MTLADDVALRRSILVGRLFLVGHRVHLGSCLLQLLHGNVVLLLLLETEAKEILPQRKGIAS